PAGIPAGRTYVRVSWLLRLSKDPPVTPVGGVAGPDGRETVGDIAPGRRGGGPGAFEHDGPETRLGVLAEAFGVAVGDLVDGGGERDGQALEVVVFERGEHGLEARLGAGVDGLFHGLDEGALGLGLEVGGGEGVVGAGGGRPEIGIAQ